MKIEISREKRQSMEMQSVEIHIFATNIISSREIRAYPKNEISICHNEIYIVQKIRVCIFYVTALASEKKTLKNSIRVFIVLLSGPYRPYLKFSLNFPNDLYPNLLFSLIAPSLIKSFRRRVRRRPAYEPLELIFLEAFLLPRSLHKSSGVLQIRRSSSFIVGMKNVEPLADDVGLTARTNRERTKSRFKDRRVMLPRKNHGVFLYRDEFSLHIRKSVSFRARVSSSSRRLGNKSLVAA